MDKQVIISYIAGYLRGLARLLEHDALSTEERFKNAKLLKEFSENLREIVRKDEKKNQENLGNDMTESGI